MYLLIASNSNTWSLPQNFHTSSLLTSPSTMAHMHTELNSGFRTLTRYDEYYLPGGDLFLLVRYYRRCIMGLIHITNYRLNVMFSEYIDISLSARAHISRENLLRLPHLVVHVQGQMSQTPYSWKTSRFTNLHDSFGFSIIRE